MQVAPYSYEQANHCIYIRNINEKVKRDGVPLLWEL